MIVKSNTTHAPIGVPNNLIFMLLYLESDKSLEKNDETTLMSIHH
jgi:hypothetical protein